jgi:stage V sporulation protein B
MITLPISIATVFATAVIPSISSSKAVKDTNAVESKIKTAIRLTMLICVPSAAGLAALGPPIIAMLFRSFPDGGVLLQIGAVNVVFIALNQILAGPLQATGYMRIPVIAALCGSVVKIIANAALIPIPSINIAGAVIGTSLCYITAASINWYWLKKTTGANIDFSGLMRKPVLCSVVMGILCYAVNSLMRFAGIGGTVSTLSAIFAGVLAYAALMVIFKGISKEDIRLFPFGKKIISVLDRWKML